MYTSIYVPQITYPRKYIIQQCVIPGFELFEGGLSYNQERLSTPLHPYTQLFLCVIDNLYSGKTKLPVSAHLVLIPWTMGARWNISQLLGGNRMTDVVHFVRTMMFASHT